jgi:glycosyltransferase involved in cell wall biosynthesis
LQGLHEEFDFVVFADRFENPAPGRITWVRVPLPRKPVLFRYLLFKWTAPFYYQQYLKRQAKPQLIISTEGQFSECDICYAHFCHKAYLERHTIQASLLRKWFRQLTRQFNAAIEAKAFEQAKVIVVPSRGLTQELAQTYGPGVWAKVVEIANPVDVQQFAYPSSFDAAVFRATLSLTPADKVILFSALGDFDRKGLEPLMQAIATLEDPQIKLLVVGGTPEEIREYTAIRDRLDLSAQVLFVGFHSDIRAYLWMSNLFALPSRYETFSLVTFQAAAAGLPLLVTPLYGVEELIEPGVNGWLVERKVTSLVGALQEAMRDRSQLILMGNAAHTAARRYDKAVFHERWRSVLQQANWETSESTSAGNFAYDSI